VIGDPLPYGIEPNRKALEDLIGHAVSQGIIAKPVAVEDLFAPASRGLVG
jgi:4,5-dihydroxyphthalate decarboxylase